MTTQGYCGTVFGIMERKEKFAAEISTLIEAMKLDRIGAGAMGRAVLVVAVAMVMLSSWQMSMMITVALSSMYSRCG